MSGESLNRDRHQSPLGSLGRGKVREGQVEEVPVEMWSDTGERTEKIKQCEREWYLESTVPIPLRSPYRLCTGHKRLASSQQ